MRKMPELGRLAGICQLVECPKGLSNGLCGITNAGGNYESDPTLGCDWVMIYRKLEKIAEPHDWSKQVRLRTLEIEPIDLMEKLNCNLCRFANCRQCQDACSMELPLSQLISMLNRELGDISKNEPGMDVNAPVPLKSITDDELTMAGLISSSKQNESRED